MAEGTRYNPVAKRYAEAAFGIATDTGTQDQWREDLESLAQLAQHAQAGAYLASGRIPEAQKRIMVQRALDVSPLAMNLALLLLQRNRLGLAPQIATAYNAMLDAARGIEQARVTTAVPLSEAEVQAVRERLREMSGARDVQIETRVDPALLGGLVVRIGDRVIDGSTRARLIQLKRSLAGATG